MSVIKMEIFFERLEENTQNWLNANAAFSHSDDRLSDWIVEKWFVPILIPREMITDLVNNLPEWEQSLNFRLDTWHVSLSDHPFSEDFLNVVGEPVKVDNTPNDSHKILEIPLKRLLLASNEVKAELFKVGEFI